MHCIQRHHGFSRMKLQGVEFPRRIGPTPPSGHPSEEGTIIAGLGQSKFPSREGWLKAGVGRALKLRKQSRGSPPCETTTEGGQAHRYQVCPAFLSNQWRLPILPAHLTMPETR